MLSVVEDFLLYYHCCMCNRYLCVFSTECKNQLDGRRHWSLCEQFFVAGFMRHARSRSGCSTSRHRFVCGYWVQMMALEMSADWIGLNLQPECMPLDLSRSLVRLINIARLSTMLWLNISNRIHKIAQSAVPYILVCVYKYYWGMHCCSEGHDHGTVFLLLCMSLLYCVDCFRFILLVCSLLYVF